MAGQNIGKGTDSTKITFLLEENETFGNVLAKQEKINQISELPRGLKNYCHIVET